MVHFNQSDSQHLTPWDQLSGEANPSAGYPWAKKDNLSQYTSTSLTVNSLLPWDQLSGEAYPSAGYP